MWIFVTKWAKAQWLDPYCFIATWLNYTELDNAASQQDEPFILSGSLLPLSPCKVLWAGQKHERDIVAGFHSLCRTDADRRTVKQGSFPVDSWEHIIQLSFLGNKAAERWALTVPRPFALCWGEGVGFGVTVVNPERVWSEKAILTEHQLNGRLETLRCIT